MGEFKIFVTLGNSKFKFDRLLECLPVLGEIGSVVIQAGYTTTDLDKRFGWTVFDFCDPEDFVAFVDRADVVISHAGVGAITSCLRLRRRAFVMARQSSFKEHINDHQIQFARHYAAEDLFEQFENSEQLSTLIREKAYKTPPSREFITNLDALKKDLRSYVRQILGP